MSYITHTLIYVILTINILNASLLPTKYPLLEISALIFIYASFHILEAIYVKDIQTIYDLEKNKNSLRSKIKIYFYTLVYNNKLFFKKIFVLPPSMNDTREEAPFKQKTMKTAFKELSNMPFIYTYQHLIIRLTLILTWGIIIYNLLQYTPQTITITIRNIILSIQEISVAEAMENKENKENPRIETIEQYNKHINKGTYNGFYTNNIFIAGTTGVTLTMLKKKLKLGVLPTNSNFFDLSIWYGKNILGGGLMVLGGSSIMADTIINGKKFTAAYTDHRLMDPFKMVNEAIQKNNEEKYLLTFEDKFLKNNKDITPEEKEIYYKASTAYQTKNQKHVIEQIINEKINNNTNEKPTKE